MDNIIVISQNVKLESLRLLRNKIKRGSESVVLSTQFIFDNEKTVVREMLGTNCVFLNFSDLMTDSDGEKCDSEAYTGNNCTLWKYYDDIKRLKNRLLVERILEKYPCKTRLLVCDDLGIDSMTWIEKGFEKVECEYYYNPEVVKMCLLKRILRKVRYVVFPSKIKNFFRRDIFVARKGGKKYLFFGSLNRVGYRLDLDFSKASKFENIKFIVEFYIHRITGWFVRNKTVRLSTLHECFSWQFPDHSNMNLKLIQDGYLPSNYCSKYLLFFGNNSEFYTWDSLGRLTFEYHGLKNRILPFRKKLYLPSPNYPTKLKKVLCVASGAGDWTAIKNRSDEDKMIVSFGKVAALFPDVEFVYRCHPVWIHPQHQGVNSIARAAEYINWLNLPKFKLSSNIPNARGSEGFIVSYKRSSFEEDLEDVDIVFGEHSVSMIDAAFKNILFCSVNVTGRRDLFKSITDLGFPHCESVDEIIDVLKSISSLDFRQKYDTAVERYNNMTNQEQ